MSKLIIPLFFILALTPLTVYAQTWSNADLYKFNTVKVGDVITWTNSDTNPHTISGTDQNGNLISSGFIYPQETVTFTFIKTGQFEFDDDVNSKNFGVIDAYTTPADLYQLQHGGNLNGWGSKSTIVFLTLPNQPTTPTPQQPIIVPPVIPPVTQTPVQTNVSISNSLGLSDQLNIIAKSANGTTTSNFTNTSSPSSNTNESQTSTSTQTTITTQGSSNTGTITTSPVNQTAIDEKIQALNDKIDLLTEKINNMQIMQSGIFGAINKIVQFLHIG